MKGTSPKAINLQQSTNNKKLLSPQGMQYPTLATQVQCVPMFCFGE